MANLLPDGELYTGTASNFQGNEPVIYKSLGQGTALKTENSLKWLQGEHDAAWRTQQDGALIREATCFHCVWLSLPDPVFVGSAYIEESQPVGNPVGDDDKIYFFFSEAGKEFDFFDNTIVSRIARVCKVRHLGFRVRSPLVEQGSHFLGLILVQLGQRKRDVPVSKHVW